MGADRAKPENNPCRSSNRTSVSRSNVDDHHIDNRWNSENDCSSVNGDHTKGSESGRSNNSRDDNNENYAVIIGPPSKKKARVERTSKGNHQLTKTINYSDKEEGLYHNKPMKTEKSAKGRDSLDLGINGRCQWLYPCLSSM
jgi:hypothetical protein